MKHPLHELMLNFSKALGSSYKINVHNNNERIDLFNIKIIAADKTNGARSREGQCIAVDYTFDEIISNEKYVIISMRIFTYVHKKLQRRHIDCPWRSWHKNPC